MPVTFVFKEVARAHTKRAYTASSQRTSEKRDIKKTTPVAFCLHASRGGESPAPRFSQYAHTRVVRCDVVKLHPVLCYD